MKILTGSEGYIGKYLREKLIDLSCFDKKIGSEIFFGFYDSFEKEVDLIYHLAAQTSVVDSFRDPIGDIIDNLFVTLEMLRFKKKIIFTSSATVYGDLYNAKEDDKLNPQSPYAISKMAAEKYIINSGVPYVILRFGNVWGRNNNKGVIKSFKEGGSIYGDGTHQRDYIYIDDIVDALLAARKWDNGIYNIGTGIPTNVNEVADMMNIEKKYIDPVKEQSYISLNIEKAISMGWNPKVKLTKENILL